MKKILITFLALATMSQVNGQDLPKPSPEATLKQRVGLTDFTVVYSRPGAKDRKVFGELVPFGKVWRTGANKATSIAFNTPVSFNGETVEAGTYSLFSIPNEGEWIIILNEETELWGTGNYDEAKDVLRFPIESMSSDMTETFTIDINHIRNNSAHLVLNWEETMVAIPLEVEVNEKAIENIAMAIEESPKDKLWGVYRSAASYYHDNKLDKKQALEYIQQSVKLNPESWYSHYLHGEILASGQKYAEAIDAAEQALELGKAQAKESGSEFSYGAMIKGSIKEWSEKK
jgi:tetratricopeptide (TPR) repeat protein